MFKVLDWFVRETEGKCLQQDSRLQCIAIVSTTQPDAGQCLKSKQRVLEQNVSHSRVFVGNYLSHKTQEDCVCCDDKAAMPPGLTSAIFKDAS